MSKPDFASLMSSLVSDGQSFLVTLPDDWLQGRTAFGGLSAALCWEAVQRSAEALPPLRSAQFAFVGPANGGLRIEPSLLRRGKSAAFYSVDLFGDDVLAVRGMLTFGASRPSQLNQVDLPAPTVPRWEACEIFFQPHDGRTFLQHFDSRFAAGARPFSGVAKPEMMVWLKLRDGADAPIMASLIALADALPPAAIVNFPVGGGPISTMTWSIDVLSDQPHSQSGWWPVRSKAQAPFWRNGFAGGESGLFGPHPHVFGHSGWGGSFGCADAEAKISIGYVMNQMGDGIVGDPRATSLCHTIYACV